MPDRAISVPQAAQIAQATKRQLTELNGRLEELEQGGTGGLTDDEKDLLISLLSAITYTSDKTADLSQLKTLWGILNVDNVVSWYRDETLAAYRHVKSMDDSWAHYIVLADSHCPGYNYGHAGAIISALLSTGKFDKYIHLGDIVDMGNTDQLAGAVSYGLALNGDMLYCMGNHEIAGNNEIAPVLYETFMSDMEDDPKFEWWSEFVPSTYAGSAFTYRNDEQKIFFIHIPHWLMGTESDLIDWIYDTFDSVPDGYTVITLSHAPSDELGNCLPAVRNSFAFLAPGKKMGGHWGGHRHIDRVYDRDVFTEILFDNDAHFNEEARVAETTFEQVISIVSVSPTVGKVKVYRIGAYSDTYAEVAPNVMETDIVTASESDVLASQVISTTGSIGSGTYNILRKWFPVDPSTVYYVYSSDIADTSKTTYFNKGEYTQKRIDKFVSGSRTALATQGVVELNTYKFKTTATAAFMLVGISSNIDPADVVVSKTPPMHDIQITDASWVAGTLNATGLPSTSTTNTRTDRPIKVKPSTQYTLANPNLTTSWVAVGFAKGPCVVKDASGDRDNFSRVTGSSLPYTFTTTDKTEYIMVAYSGTETYDGWTLTEVTS